MNKHPSPVRRNLDRLYAGSANLAAAFMFLLLLLMLVSSIGRAAGVSVVGSDDLTAWFCAAASFLALAATFKNGEMVRVGLWLEKLAPRRRWWAELFSLFVAFAFITYALWAVGRYVHESWSTNELAQGLLVIPMWIPQLSTVIGIGVFWIAVADELILVLRKQKPSYVAAADERHAKGEFGEGV